MCGASIDNQAMDTFCNRVEHATGQGRFSNCIRCAYPPALDVVGLLQVGYPDPPPSETYFLFWANFLSGETGTLQ